MTATIVWQGRTHTTARCEFCRGVIYAGDQRAKVYQPGMKAKPRSKHGPGVWVHPSCAREMGA